MCIRIWASINLRRSVELIQVSSILYLSIIIVAMQLHVNLKIETEINM